MQDAQLTFMLHDVVRHERDLDPNLTVLNYLRYRVGKTGTKEGCASGDCGACTVVLAELDGEKLRYSTVNSCLTFVCALEGKQLISVEDLKQRGKLHVVQEAMVACHGSQCGFCTPGFIMSMFGLIKNEPVANAHAIEEGLAGNLCRCTGYRPITEAANAMYRGSLSDSFSDNEAQTVATLKSIRREETLSLEGFGRRSFNPKTVTELAELYSANPKARLLAGGTDLALEVTQMNRPIQTIIYVGQVEELRRIDVGVESVTFGAAASLTDCLPIMRSEYPSFGPLLGRFASLQIRNQGTLGGNIANASPIGDGAPALMALDAQLVLRKGQLTRTLPLREFFLGYKATSCGESEFIEQIRMPRATPNSFVRFYKVSKRIDDDISAVLGAFNLTMSEGGRVLDARIAFGGMAAVPKMATNCEQVLRGRVLDATILSEARDALAIDFAPITDLRATKEYRILVAQNLLERLVLEYANPGVSMQVTPHV